MKIAIVSLIILIIHLLIPSGSVKKENAFEIEEGDMHTKKGSWKEDLKSFKIGSAMNRLLDAIFIR